ncbi:MAG: alanine racemase [Oscillospiraceae bacterium]|nr:alanine racemase [Oscillospiraceae bacterium]
MDKLRRRAWAEIDLKALEHNYHTLRVMLPQGCRLLAPVKADAYGHGAIPVARKLEALGADYLAVASLDEGIELRRAEVKAPILILGHTDPVWAGELLEHDLTQGVFDEETARALSRAAVREGRTLTVHMKADTGMSRLGLLCDERGLEAAAETMARMYALPGLRWEGIFTHFSHADGSEEYTMLQFTRFLDLLTVLEGKGITFKIRHCAASAAVLNYPCTYLDMVRPGIAFYGHYPDPSCQGLDGSGLTPLMTLKARVASVKSLPAGTAVSYGRTRVLERESRLAVLTIGYGDGLPRACSDRLRVWVGGGYATVVGRICMDLCMVDVTDLPGVKPGDEAELYGPHVPVEDAAELAGTIQYELLCNVSKRIPRIYLD